MLFRFTLYNYIWVQWNQNSQLNCVFRESRIYRDTKLNTKSFVATLTILQKKKKKKNEEHSGTYSNRVTWGKREKKTAIKKRTKQFIQVWKKNFLDIWERTCLPMKCKRVKKQKKTKYANLNKMSIESTSIIINCEEMKRQQQTKTRI